MTLRRFADPAAALLTSAGIVLVAIAASLAVIAVAGQSPGDAATAMWQGAFGGKEEIAGTLKKMIPLTLIALAWIVAFRAGRINIGFDGQIIAGGITAAVVALEVHGLPIYVHLPLGIVAGVLGGTVYAGVAAWLWAYRNVSEIITTLLLNFVAIQILNWVVRGPLQESTHGFAETDLLPHSATWPTLLPDTSLTWDVLLIPIAVVLVAFILRRTTVGFQLRLTG